MMSRPVGRIGLMRIIAIVAALAGVAAFVVLVQEGARPTPKTTQTAVLTAGTDFGLSGSVANLIPGITANLVLTVTNPYSQVITLTTVTVSVPNAPSGCPVTNLTIASIVFTGSPPAVTVQGLSLTVPAHGSATDSLPILVARSAPNDCQDVTFPFSYAGTATTSTPPVGTPTVTSLTTYPNPAYRGWPVSLSATVSSAQIAPTRPAGSVTFYRCTQPSTLPSHSPGADCVTSVPLGAPVVMTAGRAHESISTLPAGSYPIFASFTPSGTTFAPSDSTTITQRVIGVG